MKRLVKWAMVGLVLLVVAGALSHPDRKPTAHVTAAALTPSPVASPAARHVRHAHRRRRHHRRAAVAATRTQTATATPVVFAACDANIRVRAVTTTCPFAQNVFYEYYEKTFGYPNAVTVRAWSPAVHQFFRVHCTGDQAIACRAGDGGEVRFSAAAVAAYDDAQAARFAASHQLGDDSAASNPDDPAGVNIPNYANGTGYRVQCADGMYSHSGGRPGACSGHGGVGSDPYDDSSSASAPELPSSGYGENIPNYANGTGYRVQCADGMYSHSGGRPGACSGHGGEG